jgi:hypothetical protein
VPLRTAPRVSSPLGEDGASFVFPGLYGLVYVAEGERLFLALTGHGIDDGILTIVFNMLAMQLGD